MKNTNSHIRLTTLIEVRNTTKTLGEVLGLIQQYKADPMFKDAEIYLDGSKRAIIARFLA